MVPTSCLPFYTRGRGLGKLLRGVVGGAEPSDNECGKGEESPRSPFQPTSRIALIHFPARHVFASSLSVGCALVEILKNMHRFPLASRSLLKEKTHVVGL